jgi:hypothetical protein
MSPPAPRPRYTLVADRLLDRSCQVALRMQLAWPRSPPHFDCNAVGVRIASLVCGLPWRCWCRGRVAGGGPVAMPAKKCPATGGMRAGRRLGGVTVFILSSMPVQLNVGTRIFIDHNHRLASVHWHGRHVLRLRLNLNHHGKCTQTYKSGKI